MEHLLSLISEPIDIIIKQEQSHPAKQSELVEVTLSTYESITRTPNLPHNNLDGGSFVELIHKAYNGRKHGERTYF